MEMDRELSPEEKAKLIDYLENPDPRRARMAKLLSFDDIQEQQNRDLAPLREAMNVGLKKVDSVTGAPTRRAIYEILASKPTDDAAGPVGRVIDQFGADPDTAPTWPQIAEEAGVENETIKKGVGLIGPFLEPNIPFGSAAGMARKIGKGARATENVIDFEKALKEAGGPKPVDKIAQMHGETGKIVGMAEDTLPNEAKRKYGMTKIGREVEELYNKPAAEPSMREKFLARFGDDAPKIEKAMKRMESKPGSSPYATQVESGAKNLSVPIPNFNFQAGSEIGKRQISHSMALKTDTMEAIPWMDDKYQVTKNALKNATGPVRINTSSDLIAKGDYIEAIPQGSKVFIYGLSPDERLNRLLFPGNPSQKRLETAVQKLQSAGIDAKLVMPTIDEYLDRARAYDVKNPRKLSDITGLSEETTLRDMLREAGLREHGLKPVDGIDPFGQQAKSKRVRPKKSSEADDE